MPINRADFNKQNTVLFSAKLKSFTAMRGKRTDRTFIDTSQNDRIDRDFARTGITTARDIYEEPCLSVSRKKLASQLDKMGQGSVALGSELGSVNITDVTVDWGTTVFTKTEITDRRPRRMESLIDDFAPIGENKQVAIDTEAGEFLIFSPKS